MRSLPRSMCIRRQKNVVYERHLVHSSFTSSARMTVRNHSVYMSAVVRNKRIMYCREKLYSMQLEIIVSKLVSLNSIKQVWQTQKFSPYIDI